MKLHTAKTRERSHRVHHKMEIKHYKLDKIVFSCIIIVMWKIVILKCDDNVSIIAVNCWIIQIIKTTLSNFYVNKAAFNELSPPCS